MWAFRSNIAYGFENEEQAYIIGHIASKVTNDA
jgi:hypothetical protein